MGLQCYNPAFTALTLPVGCQEEHMA